MFLDADLQLSNSQALTATAVGSNTVDLSSDRSIGNGEPMAVVFYVEVAADQGTGDEDYTFEVEYASNAGQSTGRQLIGRRIFESGTPTAPAQNTDLLVSGFKVVIPIPPTELSESERYLGVRYTLSGTSPSITCSAYIQPLSMVSSSEGVSYADGYNIT